MFKSFYKWIYSGLKRAQGTQGGPPAKPFAVKTPPVTDETALQISAVWAAVQLKSTILASLDIKFYEMTPEGRRDLTDYPLAQLFNGKINRYQNRVEFFETVGLNLYLSGNAFVHVKRFQGEISALIPLMTGQVSVELLPNGDMVYTYNNGQATTVFAEESIWHIKLMGNGVYGLSPLEYAANSIGIALAGEKWASNLISNGGKPTGVLTYDELLTDEQRTLVRQRFNGLAEGTEDSLMVLEAGMKYQQVSLSPQDVQLLNNRRFQIEDLARFFNVPSVLINDTSGSTVWGSGIGQIINGWYKLSFRPELERFETSILNRLIKKEDRDRISVEFNFDELLRTDFETRVKAGAQAVNAGLMTRNEWRKSEWLPAKEGGDDLTLQVNLAAANNLPTASEAQNDD
jgi:HK97 family phage portal protein